MSKESMNIFRLLVETRYETYVDKNIDPKSFIDFYLTLFLSENDHCLKCGSHYDQYNDLNFKKGNK